MCDIVVSACFKKNVTRRPKTRPVFFVYGLRVELQVQPETQKKVLHVCNLSAYVPQERDTLAPSEKTGFE